MLAAPGRASSGRRGLFLTSTLVKTAEYRNPGPNPLQEAFSYSHPSVERRVRLAMEWKAAHGGG